MKLWQATKFNKDDLFLVKQREIQNYKNKLHKIQGDVLVAFLINSITLDT